MDKMDELIAAHGQPVMTHHQPMATVYSWFADDRKISLALSYDGRETFSETEIEKKKDPLAE